MADVSACGAPGELRFARWSAWIRVSAHQAPGTLLGWTQFMLHVHWFGHEDERTVSLRSIDYDPARRQP